MAWVIVGGVFLVGLLLTVGPFVVRPAGERPAPDRVEDAGPGGGEAP